MRKHNYLNNKDILSEIHKSKSSFCSYVEDSYNQFDLIIPLQGPHGTLEQGLAKINRNTIAEAKRNKAKANKLKTTKANKEATHPCKREIIALA